MSQLQELYTKALAGGIGLLVDSFTSTPIQQLPSIYTFYKALCPPALCMHRKSLG